MVLPSIGCQRSIDEVRRRRLVGGGAALQTTLNYLAVRCAKAVFARSGPGIEEKQVNLLVVLDTDGSQTLTVDGHGGRTHRSPRSRRGIPQST